MKKILITLFVAIALFGCQAKKTITMEEAKNIALTDITGEVIRASENKLNGNVYYEFDILENDIIHKFVISGEGNVTDYVREVPQIYNEQTNPTVEPAQPTEEVKTTATPAPTPTPVVVAPTTTEEKVITADKANAIAIKRVGGGTVTECEFDYEGGVKHYDIEVTYNFKEYDVIVNAVTGEIIGFSQDY